MVRDQMNIDLIYKSVLTVLILNVNYDLTLRPWEVDGSIPWDMIFIQNVWMFCSNTFYYYWNLHYTFHCKVCYVALMRVGALTTSEGCEPSSIWQVLLRCFPSLDSTWMSIDRRIDFCIISITLRWIVTSFCTIFRDVNPFSYDFAKVKSIHYK